MTDCANTAVPNLHEFDHIVLNDSGGKDSGAMVDEAVRLCDAAGVSRSVITVIYNDLGRISWPGTKAIVIQRAAKYGLRLVIVGRDGPDLLEDMRTRRKRDGSLRGWADFRIRYCTSDHKRGPAYRVVAAMVKDMGKLGRRARVLYALGFRAEESTSRANRPAFALNERATTKTTREVWDWLPIHHWTEDQVWQRHRDANLPRHWAYDAGMSRLSCSFCIMASKNDLCTAAKLRPDLAAEYLAVEAELDMPFQAGRPLVRTLTEGAAMPALALAA